MDQLVVAFPAHPGVTIAKIRRVVEQICVVGADVQIDGNGAFWPNTGGRSVDGELADGDIGSVDAPISNSQDLFRIGNDEQVDVIRPQLESLEGGADVLDMVY